MEKFIHNDIFIQANPETVWKVLTDAKETPKYMFGCETVSDWKIGSTLDWQMIYEGKTLVAVTGKIVELIPAKKLVYTVFDPNSAMENIPENYLTVSYELAQEAEGTRLHVSQGDYSKVAEGERRYHELYNNGEGWNPILVQIKAICEA